MDGAAELFRKKLVGMARRAVRILQRCCRYLFPRLVLAIGTWIQDSLLGLPSFLLKKPDFKKYVNVWGCGVQLPAAPSNQIIHWRI